MRHAAKEGFMSKKSLFYCQWCDRPDNVIFADPDDCDPYCADEDECDFYVDFDTRAFGGAEDGIFLALGGDMEMLNSELRRADAFFGRSRVNKIVWHDGPDVLYMCPRCHEDTSQRYGTCGCEGRVGKMTIMPYLDGRGRPMLPHCFFCDSPLADDADGDALCVRLGDVSDHYTVDDEFIQGA